MSKYKPLERHLRAARKPRIDVTFSQIEKILGMSLPESARRHPAWWSNNEGSHVQAGAWREAGYKTEGVDIIRERVTFVAESRATAAPQAAAVEDKPSSVRGALFGSMKGTTIVMPEVDLTLPTAPEWGESDDR